MHHHVYVISDLHLGGAPAADGKPGFQICPPSTQNILADFILRLPKVSKDHDCHLIIAGDIVDFLAEEPFESFTADPDEALRKFKDIVKNTTSIWTALRRFVAGGGDLVLMLGNHDIELSLPMTREALLEEVGRGRVRFIDDNQAFVLGQLLVEHGNRFDAWNAVPHGALRRMRSQLSRRLPATPAFSALPGSRLVVGSMNKLKKDYPFVDLLKPEGAAALPILAALGAGGIKDVWTFYRSFRLQNAVDYDENREPRDFELISAPPPTEEALFGLAMDIAAGGDASNISAVGDLLAGAFEFLDETKRQARRNALFEVFHRTMDTHRKAFDVDQEDPTYLTPARRSAAAGFKAVVYGHTHLAKRISIGVDNQSVYLNSGTWADLMRVPDEVWGAEPATARTALGAFVDDLEKSKLDQWRRSCGTYARIELEDDKVLSANVHFGNDDDIVTTESLLSRLKKAA